MTVNFTIDDLISKVREKTLQYPDNIYCSEGIGCFYNKGKNTYCPEEGCIMGICLRELGYTAGDIGGIITISWKIFNLPPNDNRVQWLARIQGLQDSRHNWRTAVHAADQKYLNIAKP